jgi:hypothetical protein
MSPNHDPTNDREREPRFVRQLAEHYRPEPLGPAERARFDARLRERVERDHRAAAWLPSLAGVAAALALALWLWPAGPPTPETHVVAAADLPSDASDTRWETDVLLVDEDATLAEEDYLPDDYQAIAYAFIDGA